LKVSAEDAEIYLDEALAKGVLKDGEEEETPKKKKK
jgi:CarD family transcriptional regulator